MSELRLSLLGEPEIAVGGQPVRLQRRSAVALLAYLAVTARPQHRDSLATLLAGDEDPEQTYRRLQNALADLRRAIGGHLVVDRETVALDPVRPRWLDVHAFERSAAAATAGDATAARCAADLYRGELLVGRDLPDAAGFDEWLLLQREHLRASLVETLQVTLDRHARRGAAAPGVAVARRLLALEPWREEAHRALMALLARTGQRSAALAQFETCRRALAAELGVEPDAETVALRARVLAGPHAAPSNLPSPVSPLVGREAELALLADQLADPAVRLITLVGLGGSGKTRLALDAAARCAAPSAGWVDPPFPDGVVFVPLAGGGAAPDHPDHAPDGAAGRLACTLARTLREGGESPTSIEPAAAALARKRILLVLDGLDGDAGRRATAALPALLRRCPGLRVLATTRTRLLVEGESVLEVGGLPLPSEPWDLEASPAGTLFLREAAGWRGNAPLDAAERAAAVRICRLVGGSPLALVLAAAVTRGMACADLAAELARGAHRLDRLVAAISAASGHPTPPGSLRAVLDDLWARLPAAGRGALRRLSTLVPPFTLSSAAELAGVDAPQLLALVESAAVARSRDGRYALAELVRSFAAEQLAHTPTDRRLVRARHALSFTGRPNPPWPSPAGAPPPCATGDVRVRVAPRPAGAPSLMTPPGGVPTASVSGIPRAPPAPRAVLSVA